MPLRKVFRLCRRFHRANCQLRTGSFRVIETLRHASPRTIGAIVSVTPIITNRTRDVHIAPATHNS